MIESVGGRVSQRFGSAATTSGAVWREVPNGGCLKNSKQKKVFLLLLLLFSLVFKFSVALFVYEIYYLLFF